MTTQEIITIKENQSQAFQYKLVKGIVYRKGVHDKRFSSYQSEELFVSNFVEMQNQINSQLNSKKVVDYLKDNGFELINVSIYGSHYFYTVKGIVRVSNHDYTSNFHKDPALNLCSYEQNGYEDMIQEFNNFINS